MQGFIVYDYKEKIGPALAKLENWLEEGVIESSETVIDGFDNVNAALVGLFNGDNIGKMVVRVVGEGTTTSSSSRQE